MIPQAINCSTSPNARTNAGIHDWVVDYIQKTFPDRGMRILDVGCGTGALLHRLETIGYKNLYGIDIVPPTMQRSSISFLKADLDNDSISLEDGSIDLILSIEVIEHVENVGKYIDELMRVLRRDGLMLITTPNVHSNESRLRFFMTGALKQFDGIADPTHIYPVFLVPFQRILSRRGLVISKRLAFPSDESSPTSRYSLRFLSFLAHSLGIRNRIGGDHLVLAIERDGARSLVGHTKEKIVTDHYRAAFNERTPAGPADLKRHCQH